MIPEPELVASVKELVLAEGLDPAKLTLAFETDGQRRVRVVDRHRIPVSDGHKIAHWAVPSLEGLFRGNRPPPSDMDHYPPEYAPLFFIIENQVLTLCDAIGDLTDQELEEVYSAIRRRPDGRSLGRTHDFVWQIAAFLLGCHALSAAEFEALIGALIGSTRKWGLRPVSRNYVAYLRNSFGDAHSSSLYPLGTAP